MLVLAIGTGYAQSATGFISGTVVDPSGAIIPNAKVTITNKATNLSRTLTTDSSGSYSVPALEAGQYKVRCEQAGFKTLERDAVVEAGSGTTVAVVLAIGNATEVVNVSEAATAAMNYDSDTVAGVIDHKSIESLPLNGRSFVQLASLLPGVQVVTQSQGIRNAPIGISILGGGGQYPLVTVDGLQINDFSDGNGGAGTAINFSQEVIQEFQLSSANFDLSTFTTIQGAVNMVTRSGGNDFHGGGYFFYRDHNLAANPGLVRSAFNPNPYFARKNPGGTLGGPILHDKLFFFGNYEYTNQSSAVTVQPDLASIAPAAAIFTSPDIYHYTTIRLDYKVSQKHEMFLRWTNDDNTGLGVGGATAVFPSDWVHNFNWSDQVAFGLTSTISVRFVNNFRFGFRDWSNRESFPTPSQCGTNCFGGEVPDLAPNGLPDLSMIGSSNFGVGNFSLSPQNRIARNLEPQDHATWLKGKHRVEFGADMDYYNEELLFPICETGCMSIYSVENSRSILGGNAAIYAPNLPTTVTTNADLLNLPIYYPSAGLTAGFEAGPGLTPGPWHYESERRDFRPRLFFQDYWTIIPNLTVNYGLAYAYESGLFPSDMPIPGIEAPLYGLPAGTQQPGTPPNKLNYSPAFGFAYSPGSGGKTVIRGGAGIYYDTGNYIQKLHSDANIGPVGNGPITLPSTVFLNTFTGIVQQGPGGTLIPLPVGAPIPTATFTNMTLSQFLQIYNAQIASIDARVTPATPLTGGAYMYSNADLIKQASVVSNPHNPVARSYQTSIGVQRDFGHGIVLTADWARRQIEHASLGQVDLNHFSEYIAGVQTPVIPKCTASQLFVLGQECSTGAFATYVNEGRAVYEGLLVKADKTISHHYQFDVSYAYQNLNSETVVNLNNYRAGYGPSLARSNLNAAGIVELPWGFGLSMNSSFITRTPIEVATTNIDLSGTGAVSGGPLPGLPVRGLPSKATIASAVAAFNAQYAGTSAPNGTTIPTYVLPPNYELGRPTISQDFRLTKSFSFRKDYTLAFYAEMFNAFNIANLTGYGFNLDTMKAMNQTFAFGQPTQRAGQVFNSSGPRASQFGTRISF
jgi:hypothetical protein